MSWLVIGSMSSFWSLAMKRSIWDLIYRDPTEPQKPELGERMISFVFLMVVTIVPFWVPAVGGMVVVARQLREYGMCQRFR